MERQIDRQTGILTEKRERERKEEEDIDLQCGRGTLKRLKKLTI